MNTHRSSHGGLLEPALVARSAAAKTVACDVVSDVLVIARSVGPALQDEFDGFMRWATEQLFRGVLLSSDGQALTQAQRAAVKALWVARKTPPIAVLTSSPFVRGATVAFSWMGNTPVRAFAPADHLRALEFLDVADGSPRLAVASALGRARRAVGAPAPPGT